MHDWWNTLLEDEQKQFLLKKSIDNAGENNPMFGKKHSALTKEKISTKHYEYLTSRPDGWVDPAQTLEAREKRKNSLKGHQVSEETRKKIAWL